jgi:hypothetical protein
MHSRWFNAAVVMLWLATMSWLVKEKVLPGLLVGDPPNYKRILDAQKAAPPVGWQVSLSGRSIGWALSDTKVQPDGLTDIHGRVHFDALSVDEVMPGWVRTFSRLVVQPAAKLQIDAWSTLTIDALGHLSRFNSQLRVDPLGAVIHLHGAVEGNQLQLEVRAGGATFSSEVFLPSDALLSDALSPQTELPGLRIGQKWTVPVYSPLFWPAKTPLEIIQAIVVRFEPMVWNGETETCWLVEYRGESERGAGGEASPPRGKLWVSLGGQVLKQQMTLLGATIAFDRLPDDAAVKLARSAGRQWWNQEHDPRGTIHD